jgi:hypothetical protein
MSRKKISDDTIRFLIEQKMLYVNSTVNVCMLWWVSSIVFCGYVLAAVWVYREQLGQLGYLLGLGIILFVFFFFIAYFGFLIVDRLVIVQKEIAVFADELNYAHLRKKLKAAGLDPDGGFFYTEIITFKRAMLTGALSFALVFAIWTIFWSFLLAKLEYVYALFSLLWIGGWLLLWRRRKPWLILSQLRHWLKEITQPGST